MAMFMKDNSQITKEMVMGYKNMSKIKDLKGIMSMTEEKDSVFFTT